jgi:hypothetical protein
MEQQTGTDTDPANCPKVWTKEANLNIDLKQPI